MTQHKHEDGVLPTPVEVANRLGEGKYDHSVEPAIKSLVQYASQLEGIVNALISCMHTNADSAAGLMKQVATGIVETVECTDSPTAKHVPETDQTGNYSCSICGVAL